MDLVAPPHFIYDERAVAPGTNGRGADGFARQDRAALQDWLAKAPRRLAVALATRAALRGALHLGSMFDNPEQRPPSDMVARALDERLKLLARASACAFRAVRDGAASDNLRDLATHLDAQDVSTGEGDRVLRAACLAVKAAIAEDFSTPAVEAVVASVAAAHSYAAVDPGSAYSYAPGIAGDVLAAVTQDVASLVEDFDTGLIRPCGVSNASQTRWRWTSVEGSLPLARRSAEDVVWVRTALVSGVDLVAIDAIFPDAPARVRRNFGRFWRWPGTRR